MFFQTLDTNAEFESLVRPFLASHPEIRHEWHQIRSIWSSGRTDLVCDPDGPKPIWVSLRSYQISVIVDSEDRDFEDFGRGLSRLQVAQEAFAHFLERLGKQGILLKAT